MSEQDPSQLRISDTDRHTVAEVLRKAAGEGRLDLDELDERLEAAYAAKTYADLVPITRDLPAGGQLPAVRPAALPAEPGASAASLPAARHDLSLAVLGGQRRKGVWEVGPSHQALSVMGGIVIDLRRARFAAPEVTVIANAIMGSIDVVVNARTRLSVEGLGVMGSYEEGRHKVEPQVDAASPLVRVRGLALMGSVTVVRKS